MIENRRIDKPLLSRILSERLPDMEWDSFSAGEGDWDCLLRLAQAEGVAPLLYWRLSQSTKSDLLPAKLRLALRAMYTGVKLNNEAVVEELQMLTHLFDQAEIPAVVLKGACFALTIYPEPGLRPMLDLDLLVPASDFSTALQITQSSGYVKAMPEASAGLDELLNHAACLKKTRAPFTTLELHTALVAEGSYRHAVPVDWFWSQTEPIGGSSTWGTLDHMLMLTPTAQVLYACAHAMLQHGGRNTSLRWLYDLDRLLCVYAERLDWDLLLAQARSFAWGSAVSAALSQVALLFDSAIPQSVLDELASQSDRNTERVITMQRAPATHTLEEYQKIKSLTVPGRIRLVLALAIPSPAYMRWRYGLKSIWALPAWYIFRWWGICKDGLQTIWLLRRPAKTTSHVAP